MMNRVEMVNNKIEAMENEGFVVVAVKLVDGEIVEIEMMDDMVAENTVAFGVVDVEAYEANDYEVEGLELTWTTL